jgi:hypothetical protein
MWIEQLQGSSTVGWALPTDHLESEQKDFKLLIPSHNLDTSRSRSVPSAIDLNHLTTQITNSKMTCGQCPPYWDDRTNQCAKFTRSGGVKIMAVMNQAMTNFEVLGFRL